MNEKEKEAIEIINKITEDCEYICMQRNEDTELYSDKPVPYIENRILLNLTEKQEEIIQAMAEKISEYKDYLEGIPEDDMWHEECFLYNKISDCYAYNDCEECIIEFYSKKVGE